MKKALNPCNAKYRQHEAHCSLEAGHLGDHWTKALMDTGRNVIKVDIWWIGERNAESQRHLLGAK